MTGGGGEGHLEHLVLRDRDGTERTVEAAALFVMIGAVPHKSWLPEDIELDDWGYVKTGRDAIEAKRLKGYGDPSRHFGEFETCIPGVFAVGDLRHGGVKRVASAVGEGSAVVRQILEFLHGRAGRAGALGDRRTRPRMTDPGTAAGPRVRIEEVTLTPVHPDRLADRDLDHPRVDATPPENASDIYALKVSGWAIGKRQPVTHFELVHRGVTLETVPALPGDDELAGKVELAVSSLDLPYTFRVAVRAVLGDETRARIATLSGTRAPLPGAPGPGPSPVLVTTIGRSGSTAVTNLLCHHPDFAGYRSWDTETRVVSYWTAVLRGLARPASYERQLQQPGGPGWANWWVGAQLPNPEIPDDDPALPALGRDSVEALAEFCRARIGFVGSSLAAVSGKPGARYFVEKAQIDQRAVRRRGRRRNSTLGPARSCSSATCATSRARCSRTRARQAFEGFGPQPDASIEDTIRWLSDIGAVNLVAYAERRGPRAHLLRYEDLITRPEATLTDVLEHIGADARAQTVADMLGDLPPRGIAETSTRPRTRRRTRWAAGATSSTPTSRRWPSITSGRISTRSATSRRRSA